MLRWKLPSFVRGLDRLIPIGLAVAAAALLAAWSRGERSTHFVPRVPGADRLGPIAAPVAIDLHGVLTHGEGVPASQPAELAAASWPRFRGSAVDNISHDPVTSAWGVLKTGPVSLWSIPVGDGYAGPAIHKGRVYLLDYDLDKRADRLRCLSLADGREIWSRAYSVDLKRNHGMSRTVPAVTDRYVVTFGPKCDVLCADADSGEFRWGIDLVAQFGAKVPPWYSAQCPLIDADRVILAPGGAALMIAVDCATGNIIWKTPNPLGWEMTHSSIVPVTIAGQRQYVYCASGGVIGVAAEDGRLLWQTSAWKVGMATVPTPVIVNDAENAASARLFLTGGYGAGSMMLRAALREKGGASELKGGGAPAASGPSAAAAPLLSTISSLPSGPAWDTQALYRLPPAVFGSEQQTPIYYKGFLYGVIPGGQLVCLNPETGKPMWVSNARFGIGSNLIANDRIYLLNDTGVLTIAAATPSGYQPLGRWTVLEEGQESWGPMAPAGGRLLVRDLRRLACLNLLEAPHE